MTEKTSRCPRLEVLDAVKHPYYGVGVIEDLPNRIDDIGACIVNFLNHGLKYVFILNLTRLEITPSNYSCLTEWTHLKLNEEEDNDK